MRIYILCLSFVYLSVFIIFSKFSHTSHFSAYTSKESLPAQNYQFSVRRNWGIQSPYLTLWLYHLAITALKIFNKPLPNSVSYKTFIFEFVSWLENLCFRWGWIHASHTVSIFSISRYSQVKRKNLPKTCSSYDNHKSTRGQTKLRKRISSLIVHHIC